MIEFIYEKLADEESKFIFDKRVQYWKTGDYQYIKDIIANLSIKRLLDEMIEKSNAVRDKLIVYGAGNDYELLKREYPELDFFCFCDRDKEKQKHGWYGKKVISPEELICNYKQHIIMINTTNYYKEIEEFLLKNGVEEQQIINVGEVGGILYNKQYFDKDIMKPIENERFIDGGAYDGKTSRLFTQWCHNNYQKIYAFEPDKYNYERLKISFENEEIANVELLNKGLWNEKTTLRFAMNGDQGSKIVEDEKPNVISIDTEAIDDVVGDDRITFIKMDVEGAELKALEGAKETIKKWHPRIAICIYHKPEDVVEIPAYILSLSKDYKFYIRHYQMSQNETVLYAV